MVDESGRKIFFDPKKNKKDMHTYLGIIRRSDIIRAKNGRTIKSHTGKKLKVFDADFRDRLKHLKRGPQIITPKDAGVISAYTGIGPGSRVVEAGAGSGAFTSYLANLVRPSGKVYSYERDERFYKLAKDNLSTMDLSKYVALKKGDVYEKIAQKNADLVFLDLPEPWNAIKNAEKALKPGGYFVCYLPTMNQIIRLIKALEKTNFEVFKVANIHEEIWQARCDALRPVTHDFRHTAFLVFSRLF